MLHCLDSAHRHTHTVNIYLFIPLPIFTVNTTTAFKLWFCLRFELLGHALAVFPVTGECHSKQSFGDLSIRFNELIIILPSRISNALLDTHTVGALNSKVNWNGAQMVIIKCKLHSNWSKTLHKLSITKSIRKSHRRTSIRRQIDAQSMLRFRSVFEWASNLLGKQSVANGMTSAK